MFGKPKAECSQPSAKKLGCEEADNHCEEANTFNEGTDDDHWGLDLADSLWLTSHGVHSRRTNLTETDTCTDCYDTCAESGSTLSCKKTFQKHSCNVFKLLIFNV